VIYLVWFSWVSFSLLYWILVAECLRVTLVWLVPSCGGWKNIGVWGTKACKNKIFLWGVSGGLYYVWDVNERE
jgi:hypothetical protein